MSLKDFKVISSHTPDLNKVQDNVRAYVGQLNGVILHGLILDSVELDSASTVLVPHGLGRAFQGWHILDQDGSAIVWRDAGSSADNTKFLPLKTSADVNIKLWVF